MDARTRDALSRASLLIRKLKSEKEELAMDKKGLAEANESLKAEVERLKGALKAKNRRGAPVAKTISSPKKRHKKSELYREIDQVLSEVIDEPPAKKAVVPAPACKKAVVAARVRKRPDGTSLEDACERAREGLSSGGDVSLIAEALCAIPYGTVVRFPPFRVRRQCQYRERLQKAQANEKWSSRHVLVEILAWYRAYERDAKKTVDLICLVGTKLGGDTLRVALADVSHAALSWSSFLSSLPELRKRQFDQALAHYQKLLVDVTITPSKDLPFLAASSAREEDSSSEDDDDEPWTLSTRSPSAATSTTVSTRSDLMVALLGTLCDRFDATGLAERVSEEVRRRGEFPVATTTFSDHNNFDLIPPSRLGLTAWFLIRENPMDESVARLRSYLQDRLSDDESDLDPRVAAALLATHSGESNDGVCRALIDWAASLPRAESLPLRLLRRIRALRRRPRARVINLATATDRRVAMARLALVHGIDLERCEAVDAEYLATTTTTDDVAERWSKACCDINARFDHSSRGTTCSEGELLSKTERACAASHVEQWRRAKNDDGPVIIMEDDVVLAPGFAENSRRAFENVPDDYDILLFGYFFPGGEISNLKTESTAAVLRHFIRPAYFWGLHAYSLSPKGAAKLLRHLPIDGPADVFVARLVNDRTLNAYAVKNKLAKQRTQHTSSILHTNRPEPGVTFNKAKRITFVDPINDDATEHVW